MRRKQLHLSPDPGILALLVSGLIGAGAFVLTLLLRPQWGLFGSFIAFAVGFLGPLLAMGRMFPFHCPRCGRKLRRADMLGREAGERVRFVCPICQIEWDTGLTVPHGD